MQNSKPCLIKCCLATAKNASYHEHEGDKLLQNNAPFYVNIQPLN